MVPIRDGAVATSGFAHRGTRRRRTQGQTPAGITSVSVASDLTTADLDATAALALGPGGRRGFSVGPGTGLVVQADGVALVLG